MQVSTLLNRLRGFSELYRVGDIPDVRDPFDRALFNSYRSYCIYDQFPMLLDLKTDGRGTLFECVRGYGGQSQVFCSTTHPGITRGNHFHMRKIERFIVLRGEATISLRQLFHQPIIRFKVVGDRPALVDMPTMWTHSITNTGGRLNGLAKNVCLVFSVELARRGRSAKNRLPRPSTLSTPTSPPCASTILFVSAKPRPVP